MTQTAQITAALKQVLKTRGLTYALLARRIGLSETSVKRLFSQGTFTLRRLDEICAALETDLFDLARLGRSRAETVSELSLEQEAALAGDPKLLTLFHLLLNEWRFAEIVRDYEIAEAEGIRLLARLDRLKLIELGPKNRARLLVPKNIVWRRAGPIRKVYEERVLREFFGSSFDGGDELLRFELMELTPASQAVVQRKLQRLAAEFMELAEIDASLPERRSTGLVVAIRPLVLSLASQLKRKSQPSSRR
jgi:DNA-binding Xre family transcriptional regulator